jgi:GTP pyrophosphokinase
MISRAFAEAANAHAGQVRNSGEAYVEHPLAVAMIVAELGLDDVSIAAALLHDAVEDTAVTVEAITSSFGPEVAAIVDGVTKLDRIRFDSKEEQQAATMRKMLVAMAKDLRVLLIKLADRLHNMRTIAAMPTWKQQRTATETLEIYAPLAHRLGMQDLKQQLEDLAFASLHPKRYAEIEQMVSTRSPERDLYLDQVLSSVRERLRELRINGEVTGPTEAPVVHLREDGGEGQGVRRHLRPRGHPGRRRPGRGLLRRARVDPRRVEAGAGSHQGLHRDAEVQPVPVAPHHGGRAAGQAARGPDPDPEMHQRSEYGVAAHWAYKDGTTPGDAAWIGRLLDWQSETSDPNAFMETLKGDLEQDEVFVFTPKGKVVTLPDGATPVDFAYTVHTEVGHNCIGARVNGRLQPLDSALRSGDTVEIFTSKVDGGPSRDWLQIAVTPRARNKIRQWFSRERREDAIEAGREELVKALRREGLPVQKLQSSPLLVKVAAESGYADLEALHVAVGENHVQAKTIVQRLARELRGGEAEEQLPVTARAPRRRRPTTGVTSRASTTSWSGCRAAARRCPRTRSWASSPAGGASRSTAPTAPTPPRSPVARRRG